VFEVSDALNISIESHVQYRYIIQILIQIIVTISARVVSGVLIIRIII